MCLLGWNLKGWGGGDFLRELIVKKKRMIGIKMEEKRRVIGMGWIGNKILKERNSGNGGNKKWRKIY
ncbi:hypothetical protein, partial [Siminovitchia fortis]|uniref:hypothetical protein n=1 Tax=Siminovitchia fortis TaxID=254758 RepID=UPI0011A0211C